MTMIPALFALSTAIAKVPLDAPVRSVTVYSDRARVTRRGSIDVQGTRVVELPMLARTVDPKTITVSATGVELTRVDIAWAPADELPRARVEELLDAIAKVDDQLTQLAAERTAWQGQLSIASSLRPTLPPDALGRPQPRLNAAGWGIAVEFAHTRVAVAQARLRDVTRRERTLRKERERVVAEAQKIDAKARPAGFRVLAHLVGHGTAKVSMSYMASSARWRPIYDVQLQPATSQLDVQLAGEVSQESGEDWSDAQLILSTAEPATATRYPKVTTWKVGERERFIPTPLAQLPPPSPPPRAVPPPPEVSDGKDLHATLRHALGPSKVDKSINIPTAADGRVDGNDGWTDDDRRNVDEESTTPVPPPSVPEAPAPPSVRVDELERTIEGLKNRAFRGKAKVGMLSDSVLAGAVAQGSTSTGASAESVGLVAPRGWSRPSYAADLPASLAGGYDLVFSALQPETVLSGKGTRRVALLSRRWPVAVERKLFPALAPDAFLVATLTSRDDKPLPGGRGQLFVGADPAGTAQLPLIRPGEPVTLPLGLDRAIRPIRNVKVVTVERGVIGKDEVSEYTVTIEVANPYATALPVRIVDQVPLVGDTGSKNVEVKLLRAEPTTTTRDDKLGTLEWALQLPASGKTTLSFVYSIRRPKGFQLRQ